jgi:hypothetical protein
LTAVSTSSKKASRSSSILSEEAGVGPRQTRGDGFGRGLEARRDFDGNGQGTVVSVFWLVPWIWHEGVMGELSR